MNDEKQLMTEFSQQCVMSFTQALMIQAHSIGVNLSEHDINYALQSLHQDKSFDKELKDENAPSEAQQNTSVPSNQNSTSALKKGLKEINVHQARLGALKGLLIDEQLELDYVTLADAKVKSLKKLTAPCVIVLDEQKSVVLVEKSKTQLMFARYQSNDPLSLSFEQWQSFVDALALNAQNNTANMERVVRSSSTPSQSLHIYTLRKSFARIKRDNGIEKENNHWFWSLFKAEKGVFKRVMIASLFANLLAAISSFFSLQVYDRVIPHKSEETLWALLIGVSIAFLLEGALRIIRSHLLDYSGKRIDVQATALLLRRLMGLRLSHKTPPPNRLNQQMREFNSVREFFTEAAVGSFVDIPFAVIFLIVIYLLGGAVVTVPIIALILMIIPPLLYRKKMLQIVKSYLGSHAAANRLYNELSYNLETVKNSSATRFFEQQWNDISYLVAQVSMQQRQLTTFLTQWSASIQQFAYALTITVAAYQLFEGRFTMGAMIALSILTSRAIAPFARLSSLLIRWQQIKSSLKELDDIADGEQDDPIEQKKLRREHLAGHIEIKNLQFLYEAKARPALNLQRLVIRPGEKIGILGPNGSGKSTLLKLLAGLYLPQQGELKFDGIDVRQISSKDLRREIAYNTQEAQLFNGTLRDNLTFGNRRISDEQLIHVLHQTGLGEFLQAHPYGLDLPIRDGGSGLSVGQKHSVQLARVFLSQANILLLDEPTASFDPQVEQHVIRHIHQFSKDKTFLVVTHRTPILAMVDRVIVMAQGQIIADGPRDVILNKIQQAQNETN